jgi:hypothetical protein
MPEIYVPAGGLLQAYQDNAGQCVDNFAASCARFLGFSGRTFNLKENRIVTTVTDAHGSPARYMDWVILNAAPAPHNVWFSGEFKSRAEAVRPDAVWVSGGAAPPNVPREVVNEKVMRNGRLTNAYQVRHRLAVARALNDEAGQFYIDLDNFFFTDISAMSIFYESRTENQDTRCFRSLCLFARQHKVPLSALLIRVTFGAESVPYVRFAPYRYPETMAPVLLPYDWQKRVVEKGASPDVLDMLDAVASFQTMKDENGATGAEFEAEDGTEVPAATASLQSRPVQVQAPPREPQSAIVAPAPPVQAPAQAPPQTQAPPVQAPAPQVQAAPPVLAPPQAPAPAQIQLAPPPDQSPAPAQGTTAQPAPPSFAPAPETPDEVRDKVGTKARATVSRSRKKLAEVTAKTSPAQAEAPAPPKAPAQLPVQVIAPPDGVPEQTEDPIEAELREAEEMAAMAEPEPQEVSQDIIRQHVREMMDQAD